MTGAELITKERIEQIQKHGFGPTRDDQYTRFELQLAAKAILNNEQDEWPDGFDPQVFQHIMRKPMLDQVVIAAALLAAEVDRLQRAHAQRMATT